MERAKANASENRRTDILPVIFQAKEAILTEERLQDSQSFAKNGYQIPITLET
jgi:hypothetical protein